jgi:hypothetical protein
MAGTTLTPGIKIASKIVTIRTAVEFHPKWCATPPQTPQIQRSLLARLTPMLTPRTSSPKFAPIRPPPSSITPLFLPLYYHVVYEPGLADASRQGEQDLTGPRFDGSERRSVVGGNVLESYERFGG